MLLKGCVLEEVQITNACIFVNVKEKKRIGYFFNPLYNSFNSLLNRIIIIVNK